MNNRLKNLIWTIYGNHNYDLNPFIYSNINSFFKASIFGYGLKIYDFPSIENFFNIFTKNNDIISLIKILELSIENATYNDLILERPGIENFKYEYIINLNKNNLENSIIKNLELNYYNLNNKFNENHIIKLILKEILNFNNKNTLELLNFLNHIAFSYLNLVESKKFKSKINDFLVSFKKNDINKNALNYTNNLKHTDIIINEKIESAEFTLDYSNLKIKENNVQNSINNKETNIKNLIQKNYGNSILSEKFVLNLEKTICTDIHSNINLYFTKGFTKTDSNTYYKNLQDINYNKNLQFFKQNEFHYKRNIKNLSEMLKNYILKDSDTNSYLSNSGKIIPSLIWKNFKLGNEKIFKKTITTNKENFTIDILLDQSASQWKSQEKIATEGFIIAEALTMLNIKTRVIGFNNFFNYLILRIFRDYNDSKIKNNEIFKYNPSGSNRDGLAIKLLTKLILKNKETNKLLIILSDGKPNDEINLDSADSLNINARNYTGKTAILDTYNQVLLSRLQNINVLGIFTGEDEDLIIEKKIYGSKFAYITNIERFHQIIGIFLKSIINEIH